MTYAARLIEHMIEYDRRGVYDASDCLSFVTKAIVEREKWGGVEIGFYSAVGQFLTNRLIRVTPYFDAKIDDTTLGASDTA